MYASSAFLFTAILALARIALATPPACLIAAMGAQPNPADLKSLCGSLESQVVGNITEKCSGSAESAAISVYSATCLASASVTISIPSSTSTTVSTSASTSASATGTGKTTITGTASASATGSPAAKATGSASGSSSTGSATGTAASASVSSTKSSSAGSNSPQFVLALMAAGFASQYLL